MTLGVELDRSMKLLRAGLGAIQGISGANDFYDAPFMFLTNGFERLFKVMLCFSHLDSTGCIPTSEDRLWSNGRDGHDLVTLRNKVADMCKAIDSPDGNRDMEIIRSEPAVDSLLQVLKEYGNKGRYFHLSTTLGMNPNFDPFKEWERLETSFAKRVLGRYEFFRILENPSSLDESYQASNVEMVAALELFLRALARQFVWGTFSAEARTYMTYVDAFSDIEDDELGRTDYQSYKPYERIGRPRRFIQS